MYVTLERLLSVMEKAARLESLISKGNGLRLKIQVLTEVMQTVVSEDKAFWLVNNMALKAYTELNQVTAEIVKLTAELKSEAK